MEEKDGADEAEHTTQKYDPSLLGDSETAVGSTGEEFENIINAAGGMGRFQVIILLIVAGSKFAVAWAMMLMAFGGKIPDWWCLDASNFTDPLYKTCEVNGTVCQEVKYSEEMVTVASQFNLICNRMQFSALITSIQVCGDLFGSLLTGQMSELFGRKKVFFSLIAGLMVFSAGSSFVGTWQTYAIMRFLIGATVGGILVLNVGIAVEFTPAKWRSCISGFPSWDVGETFFALCAYLTKNWRYASMATGVIAAPFLSGWFIVPESIRWLLAHDKTVQAEEAVRLMAKINRKACPDLTKLEKSFKTEISKQKKTDRKYSYLDLIRRWDIAKMTLPLSFVWVSMALTSYGISFGVVQLSGDLYLNLFISGMVGVPGTLATIYTNDKFGRKWTIGISSLFSALAAIVIVPISYLDLGNKGTIISGLAMTSKFAVNIAWKSSKLHTAEMFPTVIRNLASGLVSTISRIGIMTAPQLIYLTQLNGSLMYLVIGILMAISAMFVLSLPETRGEALQDVIDIKIKPSDEQIKLEDNATALLT